MQKEKLSPSGFSLAKAAERVGDNPLGAKYGNAGQTPKPQTARKLVQEQKLKMVLGQKSSGLYKDLRQLQKEYNEKIRFKGDTKGLLREIAEDPFHLCIWRREQLAYANRVFSQGIFGERCPLSLWTEQVP